MIIIIMSSSGFCYSSKSKSENKRGWKDRQIFGSCQRAEKAVEHDGDGDTNCSWDAWNSSQRLEEKNVGIGV